MIIGYARVSTEDQHLDAQIAALEAAGAERVFAEKSSGTKKSRPELDCMIEQLRSGDVVVVTKYDRLSRSLQDLLSIVDAVRAQGAGFRSLAEDIDTTTPAGRLVFHVFASIAQFERERISERTKEGLTAARMASNGKVGAAHQAKPSCPCLLDGDVSQVLKSGSKVTRTVDFHKRDRHCLLGGLFSRSSLCNAGLKY